jgi:hypothetical protein
MWLTRAIARENRQDNADRLHGTWVTTIHEPWAGIYQKRQVMKLATRADAIIGMPRLSAPSSLRSALPKAGALSCTTSSMVRVGTDRRCVQYADHVSVSASSGSCLKPVKVAREAKCRACPRWLSSWSLLQVHHARVIDPGGTCGSIVGLKAYAQLTSMRRTSP